MEQRPNKSSQMLTGKELVAGIQRKFIKDVLPELEKNERWRQRSRYASIRTCPPGGCPKPFEYPAPRFNLDESD